MIYFDATFLAKFYLKEPGSARVVELVEERRDVITSSVLGKMETEATFHRKLREKEIDAALFRFFNRQFEKDSNAGRLAWLPISAAIIERVHQAYLNLPADVFLRTGDAIHLATASEAGFKEIYSNDRHLLAAAPKFKLKGTNPLKP